MDFLICASDEFAHAYLSGRKLDMIRRPTYTNSIYNQMVSLSTLR